MATIDDLRALGLRVGIAHGSVQVEEDALHNARVEASPQTVTRRAGAITKDTLADLANAGQLPVSADEKQVLAAQIAEAALEMVTTHANEKVEFHQRAVEEAKAMPDVWHVAHIVEHDGREHVIASSYISTKADGTGWDEESQAALDGWVCPIGYNRNSWIVVNPEADAAARTLLAKGCNVEWPPFGEHDTFTVDGCEHTTDEIIAKAEEVAARPPEPTAAEKVVAVLEAAPEISDETKKSLRDALAPAAGTEL